MEIKTELHKLAKRIAKLNGGSKDAYGKVLEYIHDTAHCMAEDRNAGRPQTMIFFRNYSSTIDVSKVKKPVPRRTKKKITKKKVGRASKK